MANPISVSDIEARWRPLSSEERTVTEALIADAWEVLLASVDGLVTRLDDGSLSEGLVIAVEAQMILRVLRNPDGKKQEAIDDYSWIRDGAVSAGLLYVLEAEAAMLGPGTAAGTAYTIRPYGAPGYAVNLPMNYWELNLP